MNHSAKRQHHEQARKKHKHEQQQHAREAARRERSRTPVWFLVIGIALMLLLVFGALLLY